MSSQSLEAQIRAAVVAEDGSSAGGQLSLEIFEDQPSPVEVQLRARGVEARGRGRPQGSKDRRNVDLVKLIKATKRPTLLAMKEWVDLPFDEFVRATGMENREKAFGHWRALAELVAAYEEGRPTQRIEVDGGVGVPLVVFAEMPVRDDLAHGNPPEEADAIDVVDFSVVDMDASTNDKG